MGRAGRGGAGRVSADMDGHVLLPQLRESLDPVADQPIPLTASASRRACQMCMSIDTYTFTHTYEYVDACVVLCDDIIRNGTTVVKHVH